MATTSTHFLQPLRETLGARLSAQGLVAELSTPPARIELRVACEVWRQAEAQTAGEVEGVTLGLAVARRLEVGTYGLLEMTARTAPTLGDTLNRFAEHHALVNDAAELTVSRSPRELLLLYEVPVAYRPLPAAYQEYLFCSWVLLARSLTSTQLLPERVELPHPWHHGSESLAPALGASIQWEQPRAQLSFPSASAELPVRGFEPRLAAVVDSHARAEVQRVRRGVGWAQRVIERVDSSGCSTGLGEIAKSLGVSDRALRRHLQQEGTSFSRVVNNHREGTARRLLATSEACLADVADVAEACGFSDLKAFHRAFLRWTGQTPAAYRRGASTQG